MQPSKHLFLFLGFPNLFSLNNFSNYGLLVEIIVVDSFLKKNTIHYWDWNFKFYVVLKAYTLLSCGNKTNEKKGELSFGNCPCKRVAAKGNICIKLIDFVHFWMDILNCAAIGQSPQPNPCNFFAKVLWTVLFYDKKSSYQLLQTFDVKDNNFFTGSVREILATKFAEVFDTFPYSFLVLTFSVEVSVCVW